MIRDLMTDAEWEIFRPFLIPKRGRRPRDHRKATHLAVPPNDTTCGRVEAFDVADYSVMTGLLSDTWRALPGIEPVFPLGETAILQDAPVGFPACQAPPSDF